MGFSYIVKQGDHLPGIAAANGFADYHAVWDHPDNAALRAKRPNPNVLAPGDEVFVPDKEPRVEQCATGKLHTFVTTADPLMLRFVLRGFNLAPIAETDCELVIGGRTIPLHTNADGMIETPIEPDDRTATLTLGERSFDIRVGELDPVDPEVGLVTRLRNMGYLEGALLGDDENDVDAEDLRFAIAQLQRDQELTVDGAETSELLARLEEIYGC